MLNHSWCPRCPIVPGSTEGWPEWRDPRLTPLPPPLLTTRRAPAARHCPALPNKNIHDRGLPRTTLTPRTPLTPLTPLTPPTPVQKLIPRSLCSRIPGWAENCTPGREIFRLCENLYSRQKGGGELKIDLAPALIHSWRPVVLLSRAVQEGGVSGVTHGSHHSRHPPLPPVLPQRETE